MRTITADAGLAATAELKAPEDRTEEEKMALLGRPRLGEISNAQIRIKESKEFKNTVDKLVQRANASIILGIYLINNIYCISVRIIIIIFYLLIKVQARGRNNLRKH